VSGFTRTGVTISGTAGGTKTITVSGGPSTYTVAVSGMTTSGTVIATIPAGVATDAAGNGNTASTSTDNSVTFDSTTPPTVTRFEDTDPAISYTANWTRMSDTRVSGETYMEANLAGEGATLSFTGTAVSWISARFPTAGIAHVYVDGTLVGTVDTYAPTPEAQVKMFTADGLPRGTHTMTIEATGDKNPSSGNAWVVVDAFDVTP